MFVTSVDCNVTQPMTDLPRLNYACLNFKVDHFYLDATPFNTLSCLSPPHVYRHCQIEASLCMTSQWAAYIFLGRVHLSPNPLTSGRGLTKVVKSRSKLLQFRPRAHNEICTALISSLQSSHVDNCQQTWYLHAIYFSQYSTLVSL